MHLELEYRQLVGLDGCSRRETAFGKTVSIEQSGQIPAGGSVEAMKTVTTNRDQT